MTLAVGKSRDEVEVDPLLRALVTQTGDTATITLIGDIDISTAPILSSAIDQAGHPAKLVFDLRRCGFCDARGVTMIANAGPDVRVRGAVDIVARVFTLFGWDRLLTTTAS